MSDREHEVERLFRGLLELGEGVDCDAYLCRECRSDESVRRRVKALVRAYRGAGDFLEEDVVGERLDGAGVGLAGRRVAGYRVLRLVSGGASCVVYLAEQLEPVRRPVALKLSRPGEGVERARIRFAAERQAMAVLDHPNVVQLYDAGDWEGLPFIVSEWVGGESLLEYAERGQLGVGARVELFLQACLGVVHGHERGVVHRDIKPANILVTEREGVALVKVIDFGVSGASGHELGGGEGTPGYMSPEQLVRGVGAADVREDVYGLGVILHELLTGRRPRVEPGVGWVIEQDRGDSGLLVELERWMAGGLEGVLRRALAWEREGRYGSVMELVGDLRELLGAIRDGESRGGLALLLRRHRGWVAVAAVW
ncbi:MAG: Serine/threonine-protein kinase PknB, partial [Verrucomicrobiota bacterium]